MDLLLDFIQGTLIKFSLFPRGSDWDKKLKAISELLDSLSED